MRYIHRRFISRISYPPAQEWRWLSWSVLLCVTLLYATKYHPVCVCDYKTLTQYTQFIIADAIWAARQALKRASYPPQACEAVFYTNLHLFKNIRTWWVLYHILYDATRRWRRDTDDDDDCVVVNYQKRQLNAICAKPVFNRLWLQPHRGRNTDVTRKYC